MKTLYKICIGTIAALSVSSCFKEDTGIRVTESFEKALEEYISGSGSAEPYVDLGLSVKWASCNLGASKPEETGDYYMWADTKISFPVLGNCPYHKGTGMNVTWTKYNDEDGKTVLEPEDDAACFILGDKWRMPTKDEILELKDDCTWTWTTVNEVEGYLVSGKKPGYTDKSIFIPMVGYREGNGLINNGVGYYWSSTSVAAFASSCLVLSRNEVKTDFTLRQYALPIRPVYGEASGATAVTSVSLDRTSVTLTVGETITLKATVNPSNATDKTVTWTSSDQAVVTVEDGVISARKAGLATITVIAGDKTATCGITVANASAESEAVDLGLSVKWASCNLGAYWPEAYGGYFQWAGKVDVNNSYVDISKCPYHTDYYDSSGWTKYISSNKASYWSGAGNPDNKTVLDPSDDAANSMLGGKWRIPTVEEWDELTGGCSWTWMLDYKGSGVNGYIVAGKKSGYTDKSIFIPAAGYFIYADLDQVGAIGEYWSSSLNIDSPNKAYHVMFNAAEVKTTGNGDRYFGYSVRPVYGEPAFIKVTGVTVSPSSASILTGEAVQLAANVQPTNATERSISWTSSNTGVASVDGSGLVTGLSVGTTTITATTVDGGFTATCTVNVMTLPKGALRGMFSVSASKKVYFSQGNLQAIYDGNGYNWSFASNQYDFIGAAAGNTTIDSQASGSVVDLFGWSTSKTDYGISSSTYAGNYSGSFLDWGMNIGDGDTWRVLTNAEWKWLIESRSASTVCGTKSTRYAKGIVNGIPGLILFPDSYTHPSGMTAVTKINSKDAAYMSNQYSAAQWFDMEVAGAVFLPAAGNREGSVVGDVGSYGVYWSSTVYDNNYSYYMRFYSSIIDFGIPPRERGCSVRLVTECQ